MVRTIHALLLIALMLTCPYRCSGMVGVACAAAEQSSSCTTCSHHCESSSPVSASGPVQPESVPSSPADDCLCGDCLCKGAVLTDNDSVHDAFFTGLWGMGLLPQSISLVVVELTPELNDGPPPSTFAAGRPLRLVLQSLQI